VNSELLKPEEPKLKLHLYALHGFLGHPSDWTILGDLNYYPVDLFADAKLSYQEFAQQFNQSVETEHNILVGYSLGGRLAMHALLANTRKWNGAIFISAHPGLVDQKQKQQREQLDQEWAQRFLIENWDSLLNAWNDQPAFEGCHFKFERNETLFSRKLLNAALINWSLGKQEDLSPLLAQLDIPILWIAGDNDKTHKKLALKQAFRHPDSRVYLAPNAGHRVPWEATDTFIHEIKLFLSKLEKPACPLPQTDFGTQ